MRVLPRRTGKVPPFHTSLIPGSSCRWHDPWLSESKGSEGKDRRKSLIGWSGGGGIRTREGVTPVGFQDRCNRPLCHPSGKAFRSLFLGVLLLSEIAPAGFPFRNTTASPPGRKLPPAGCVRWRRRHLILLPKEGAPCHIVAGSGGPVKLPTSRRSRIPSSPSRPTPALQSPRGLAFCRRK
jgi:hypothetical protein